MGSTGLLSVWPWASHLTFYNATEASSFYLHNLGQLKKKSWYTGGPQTIAAIVFTVFTKAPYTDPV